MLSCYIIDDEQNAVDALKAMLQKKFAQQIIVCGCNIKASIAIEQIETLQPDIVFLDVEMPEMNGLELLKHFPARKFQIIFTTAHEKYALPAIKAEAADYLVKPLSPQDVYDSLQKCIAKTNSGSDLSEQRISLNTLEGLLLIDINEIIRIEANNNYSHFYFINRPKIIISKTLKEFDGQLSSLNFFRVHQSHLVNLKHVISLHGDYALMANKDRVEISRRQKKDFIKVLKKAWPLTQKK